jgi:HAD superfamily hydrolase (TIGR01549 family)
MRNASSTYSTVLFDWDDTLCTAVPHRFTFAQEVLTHLGTARTIAEVAAAFVRAGDALVEPPSTFLLSLPIELGINPELHADFIHRYEKRNSYKRFQLFDDVHSTLQALVERDIQLGVISNYRNVKKRIDEFGLTPYFHVVVTPDTFGIAKPHYGIFRRALETLGVQPAQALYVGDSYHNDVLGARAADMHWVLVNRFQLDLDEPIDGYQIQHLSELISLLGNTTPTH